MNGGLTECSTCDRDPCICDWLRKHNAEEVAKTGIDVFSKVRRWRIKLIKWLWPDLQRLSDALYDYWDKSQLTVAASG